MLQMVGLPATDYSVWSGHPQQQTTASGLTNMGFLRSSNLVYCHGELQRPVGDLEPKAGQPSKAQNMKRIQRQIETQQVTVQPKTDAVIHTERRNTL